MTMHRFNIIFLGLMMTVVAVLTGCGGGGNLEEKLYGGWKSQIDGANGKPIVLLIDKDSLTLNGQGEAVVFQSISLNVEVLRASDRKPMLMATGIGKDTVELQGDMLPLKDKTVEYEGEKMTVKVKFDRITEEEAKQLMSEPQSRGREGAWAVFIAGLW